MPRCSTPHGTRRGVRESQFMKSRDQWSRKSVATHGGCTRTIKPSFFSASDSQAPSDHVRRPSKAVELSGRCHFGDLARPPYVRNLQVLEFQNAFLRPRCSAAFLGEFFLFLPRRGEGTAGGRRNPSDVNALRNLKELFSPSLFLYIYPYGCYNQYTCHQCPYADASDCGCT